MTVAVLSNHRRVAPFGLAGGEPGATGVNSLLRASGTAKVLPACAAERVVPGDVIRIETPGGGGFGEWPKAGPAAGRARRAPG